MPHINAHGHLIVCMEMLHFSYFSKSAVPRQSVTQHNTQQSIFLLQKMQSWARRTTLAVLQCFATLLQKQISHLPFGHSSSQGAEICHNKMLQVGFLSAESSGSRD